MCFGIGHNLSLICQLTSEDIKSINSSSSLTCFHNPWNYRFHNVQAGQPLKMEHNICTHVTVNYTNTHENWADSFYHSRNTCKSHNPYIWRLFSALSVSLCNIYKNKKNLSLVITLTGIIECIVNMHFFFKQEEHQHIHQDLQPA